MTSAIHRLWGVIRYETLMQWRRRTILVLCVFFGIGMIGLLTAVASAREGTRDLISVDFEGDTVRITSRDEAGNFFVTVLTGDDAAAVPHAWNGANFQVMANTWNLIIALGPGSIVLLLAIAALLGDVIPIDRQFRVRELLNSTPLTNAAYITGKLFSIWIGLAAGLAITGLVIMLYAHFRIGALDGWLLTRFWAVDLIPAALVMAGFPVLIGGLAQTRRGPVLIFLIIAMMPVAIAIAVSLITQGYVGSPILSADVGALYDNYGDAVAHMLIATLAALIPFAVALIGAWGLLWWVERRRNG